MKETHDIDDLLKIVEPKLVAGYEARNLNGKSLSKVNEEYKTVVQGGGLDFIDSLKLVLFSVLIGALLYLYLWIFTDVLSGTAFVSMMMIIAPAYLYFIFVAARKEKRKRTILDRCAPILCEFRQAVEALNVPLAGMMEEYNQESIHDNLIVLVLWLLRAESSFKQIRLTENIPSKTVISYGEAEEACRKHFETMLSAAEKFGLVFSKAELFREGMNQREHMKALC